MGLKPVKCQFRRNGSKRFGTTVPDVLDNWADRRGVALTPRPRSRSRMPFGKVGGAESHRGRRLAAEALKEPTEDATDQVANGAQIGAGCRGLFDGLC
jgi:hypothetical protein